MAPPLARRAFLGLLSAGTAQTLFPSSAFARCAMASLVPVAALPRPARLSRRGALVVYLEHQMGEYSRLDTIPSLVLTQGPRVIALDATQHGPWVSIARPTQEPPRGAWQIIAIGREAPLGTVRFVDRPVAPFSMPSVRSVECIHVRSRRGNSQHLSLTLSRTPPANAAVAVLQRANGEEVGCGVLSRQRREFTLLPATHRCRRPPRRLDGHAGAPGVGETVRVRFLSHEGAEVMSAPVEIREGRPTP